MSIVWKEAFDSQLAPECVRVDLQTSPFGLSLRHGLPGPLVALYERIPAGWRALGNGFAKLPHQTYWNDLSRAQQGATEVVAVCLGTGQWRTVWAATDDDVTYPAIGKPRG